MDIPLLFECGLDKMCDYVILMYSTKTIRRERALKRPGMDKAMFSKIVKNQIGDSFKKRKSNFVINSNTSKRKTFAQTIQAIQKIEKNNA